MKISKSQLRRIVKEELRRLYEAEEASAPGALPYMPGAKGEDIYAPDPPTPAAAHSEGEGKELSPDELADAISIDQNLADKYSTGKPFYHDFPFFLLPQKHWPKELTSFQQKELKAIEKARSEGRKPVRTTLITQEQDAVQRMGWAIDRNTGRIFYPPGYTYSGGQREEPVQYSHLSTKPTKIVGGTSKAPIHVATEAPEFSPAMATALRDKLGLELPAELHQKKRKKVARFQKGGGIQPGYEYERAYKEAEGGRGFEMEVKKAREEVAQWPRWLADGVTNWLTMFGKGPPKPLEEKEQVTEFYLELEKHGLLDELGPMGPDYKVGPGHWRAWNALKAAKKSDDRGVILSPEDVALSKKLKQMLSGTPEAAAKEK